MKMQWIHTKINLLLKFICKFHCIFTWNFHIHFSFLHFSFIKFSWAVVGGCFNLMPFENAIGIIRGDCIAGFIVSKIISILIYHFFLLHENLLLYKIGWKYSFWFIQFDTFVSPPFSFFFRTHLSFLTLCSRMFVYSRSTVCLIMTYLPLNMKRFY